MFACWKILFRRISDVQNASFISGATLPSCVKEVVLQAKTSLPSVYYPPYSPHEGCSLSFIVMNCINAIVYAVILGFFSPLFISSGAMRLCYMGHAGMLPPKGSMSYSSPHAAINDSHPRQGFCAEPLCSPGVL